MKKESLRKELKFPILQKEKTLCVLLHYTCGFLGSRGNLWEKVQEALGKRGRRKRNKKSGNRWKHLLFLLVHLGRIGELEETQQGVKVASSSWRASSCLWIGRYTTAVQEEDWYCARKEMKGISARSWNSSKQAARSRLLVAVQWESESKHTHTQQRGKEEEERRKGEEEEKKRNKGEREKTGTLQSRAKKGGEGEERNI